METIYLFLSAQVAKGTVFRKSPVQIFLKMRNDKNKCICLHGYSYIGALIDLEMNFFVTLEKTVFYALAAKKVGKYSMASLIKRMV